MNFRFNISAGELFDLVSPVVFVVSVLVSTWVLSSARKRFPLWISLLWATGTFLMLPVVLPLYLISTLIWPRRFSVLRWRYISPSIYSLILLTYFAVTFYSYTQSADAHLARATAANLVNDKQKQIAEYRKALEKDDDANIHKLLGMALFEVQSYADAIAELKTAESQGDADDAIPYWIAMSLEKLEERDAARVEYQRFLRTNTCSKIDSRCEMVQEKLKAY